MGDLTFIQSSCKTQKPQILVPKSKISDHCKYIHLPTRLSATVCNYHMLCTCTTHYLSFQQGACLFCPSRTTGSIAIHASSSVVRHSSISIYLPINKAKK